MLVVNVLFFAWKTIVTDDMVLCSSPPKFSLAVMLRGCFSVENVIVKVK